MRDTQYATEIASVSIAGDGGQKSELKLERLYVKKFSREEIRLSWWVEGRLTPRPAGLTEGMLLEIMNLGMRKGVFSADFLVGVRNSIDAYFGEK